MNVDKLVKRKKRAKRDGNVRQVGEISKELGDIYFETGRLGDALLEYTEQLQACEELEDKLNCAIAHRMIGEVHASLGDYEEALTHQMLHLEGAKEMENVLEQQRAYATIGRTHFCLGEALAEESSKRQEAFVAAKKAYSKSLKLCDLLENTDIKQTEMMTMRARLLLNLGLVLEEQKQPERAVELIEKAAELCKKYKLDEDLHRTHLALGALHERQGHFGLALRQVEKAIDVGDSTMKAIGRLTKAELLLRLGHWLDARQILVGLYLSKDLSATTSQQAERLLRIVVTICRAEESLEVETDIDSRQKLYEKLGDAATAVRSFTKAIEYYRGMLACADSSGDSPEQMSAALVSLVQTFRDAGSFEEAVPFARRELKLCTEPSEICRSALNLADLLHLTKHEKSSIMELYDLALSKARAAGSRSMEASVLKDLAVYLEETGDFDRAEETKKELDLLSDAVVDSASEAESENANIGAELCLEDLSDVEAEMQKNHEPTARSSRRPKRGLVVKRNDKGETKLHVACINGNIEEVEKLLAAGHPTDVKDHCGWTPLHEAANHGFVEIAELLIKSGANVNDPGGSMCGGVTPLHDAASNGNFSIMCLLMKHGADLLVRTKAGDSVLDCLEGWRDRAEDLSVTDQADYENVHATLSNVLPRSKKDRKKVRKAESGRKNWGGLVDEDDRESDDRGSDDERISAGEDYRRTIASLKNPGRLIGSTVEKRSVKPKKSAAPLIDSEEILIDDWLEDDLDCNVTVRERTLVDNLSISATKRKSRNSTPDVEKPSKRQRVRSNESMEILGSTGEDNSCESTSNGSAEISNNRQAMKLSKKRPRQISLFSSGFTRDSISRTPSPTFSYSAEASNRFERISEAASELIKVQIRIEDRVISLKLRFPEQREATVASIMDDVVKKFEEDTGCKIQVTLTTMSGEVLLRENTMKNVKPVEGVLRLMAEIVENVVPPINERYIKISKTHQIQPRETLLKCLRNCESTSTFRLKSSEACDDEMLPLLKCLEYQHKLQDLRLNNTSLFNLGDDLSRSLRNLTILQELHLQGCDIDHNCLTKIERFPLQLRVLDLSYNPLGPRCQDTLYRLLHHHRKLQTLNLCFCKLERFRSSENWVNLVNLDLSSNSIVGEDSICCLQRQMLSLNISNTCNRERSSLVRDTIDGSTLSLTTLETLELACCDVTDADVKKILTRAGNLSKIVLYGNSKLTKIGVEALLNRSPTLSYIDASGCETISEFPEPDTRIENPCICTLIVSMTDDVEQGWLGLWQGTANAHKLPYDIITFKPISY